MKKILFIFVLSLYSIQGLASSCPDGSEPVKSISDDGTYYVFNCPVSVSTTEASSPRSSKLLQDKLKEIKVVKDWEPIADWESVKEYAKLVPIPEWKNEKFYDQYVDRNCIERFTTLDPYPADASSGRIFTHCGSYLHAVSSTNPQILGDILLSWASASKDPMFVVPFEHPAHTTAGYNIPSNIGTFAQSYAFWYDEIEYTPEERQRVDAYMTRKLMEQKFLPIDRDFNGPRIKCDINDINSVLYERTGTNNCGNIRMKVAVGEIMLGFRLENQTLLDKGHDDMYVVHAFINEDGININHAARGGNTVNYSWEYTYYSSLLAEIYDSVGYDYLEHTLPRGAKVHEYLSFNYRLLKDFKLTAQWAKYDVGSLWLPYSQIKNLSQQLYEKTTNGGWAYSWEDGDKEFVKAHTKFVKRYMPELYTFDVKNYMGSTFNDSPNFGVHPYMLHIGNNLIEENLNTSKIEAMLQKELDEKKRIEDKKKKEKERIKAAACQASAQASALNGEYIARWYLGNQNNNLELEFQGLETLNLENCSGVFEGKESFQPSKNLRKDLNITFDPNGSIIVSGELDLFDKGDERETELKGDINSGEISGIWGSGDLIKIRIERKKEFDEKKRVEAEKKKEKDRIEAEACKTTPFNGEYEARWIRDHWRDIGEWEFLGSEPLTLDQCEGQFEGIKQFDPRPTPSVRKKLIVKYQTNGDISIKGDLNLYDIDDLRYTELYGNINDGEISGVWGVGDRLKIELIKK
jgi:hypothetical protein